MGIKRTTADKWFSKCVRLRTNWICEGTSQTGEGKMCGIDFSHDHGSLHCSHYISRNYKIVRFDPRNALAHCHKCHDRLGGGRWGGGNQAEFAYNYDVIYSPQIRELMRLLSKYPYPRFKSHEKAIAKHYLSESKRLEEMRNDGVEGRIEFDGYFGCNEINDLTEKLEKDVIHLP